MYLYPLRLTFPADVKAFVSQQPLRTAVAEAGGVIPVLNNGDGFVDGRENKALYSFLVGVGQLRHRLLALDFCA